jgi:hypothetical protein
MCHFEQIDVITEPSDLISCELLASNVSIFEQY